jgi:hypothetical protein
MVFCQDRIKKCSNSNFGREGIYNAVKSTKGFFLVTGQANNLVETGKNSTNPMAGMAGTTILVLEITPPTSKMAASSPKTVPPFLWTISFLVWMISFIVGTIFSVVGTIFFLYFLLAERNLLHYAQPDQLQKL